MIMEGINEKLQNEHEDYIQLKTRVDVAVELIRNDEFLKTESILRVLGTEKAMKLAEEIRRKDEEKKAKDLEKYSGAVSADA